LQAHLKATQAEAPAKAFKRACKEKSLYTQTRKIGYILTINKPLAIKLNNNLKNFFL
jgi:hypothetical protein